jgi:beta-lactamase superfamily II metal-dependent hydrolase
LILEIFDVAHGACALLTADNNTQLMIDCASNSETGWQPGDHLIENGRRQLAMLAITNYDEDHARGAPRLFDQVDVRWLMRNKTVPASAIRSLKSEDGMGPGIARLVHEIETSFSGHGLATSAPEPMPVFQGLDEQKAFHCTYPRDFDDENNLSLALFLKCHGIGVMFTGDLECPALDKMIAEQPDFRRALTQTNVYIAPHHGRLGGCSDAAAALLKNVFYVVISDKGFVHETQETGNYYRGIANGGPFRVPGERRFVLTTRNDEAIRFRFSPGQQWSPY